MRIMCVAIVLVVFVSDRQEELATSAGSGNQRRNKDHPHDATKPPHDGPSAHQHSGRIVDRFQTASDRDTGFLHNSSKSRPSTDAEELSSGHSNQSIFSGNQMHELSLKKHENSNRVRKSIRFQLSRDIAISYFEYGKFWRKILTALNPRTVSRSDAHFDLTRLKIHGQNKENAFRTVSSETMKQHRAIKRRQAGQNNQLPASTEIGKAPKPQNESLLSNQTTETRTTVRTPQEGENKDAEPGLLEQPTGFKKVTYLILFTFPTGVFMGYLVVAVVFFVRLKRCLCCSAKCEMLVSKCPYMRHQSNSMELSKLQISRHHDDMIEDREEVLSNPEMMRKQFQEDRRYFQKHGRDRILGMDTGEYVRFRGEPSLPKKDWMRKRLLWWLANDRRRCLKGQFTDPCGPPDNSGPVGRGSGLGGIKNWSVDFSSVSQQQSVRPGESKMPGRKKKISLETTSSASSGGSYESETTLTVGGSEH